MELPKTTKKSDGFEVEVIIMPLKTKPESFTPDTAFMVGEAPGLKNFFIGCGMNSVGIQSAGFGYNHIYFLSIPSSFSNSLRISSMISGAPSGSG